MRRAVIGGLLLATAAVPLRVSARADIKGIITGSAFDDRTPAAPVGGNPGTTLGEQRRRALERAFELWQERLDSAVPIEVAFEFEALGCMNGTTILGGASPASAFGKVDGANSDLIYVSALANSLMGRDLDPSEPDIVAQFNSSVDNECKGSTGGFYYGFDGKPVDSIDFVHVVLYELAHGLGLTSTVNLDTGEMLMAGPDSYTAHVHDLDLDRAWPELTDAQRKLSAVNVRRVVWDGDNASRLVPMLFAPEMPTLSVEPKPNDFTSAVADVVFAQNPAQHSVSGTLQLARDCNPARVPEQTILLFAKDCEPRQAAAAAIKAGAVGALLTISWPFQSPAMPVDDDPKDNSKVTLPMLSLAPGDGASLARALTQSASPMRVTMSGDGAHHIGEAGAQHPLLFASQPMSRGSTISHLEELVRPNQLMEPYAAREPAQALELTLALLRDVGWRLLCGNGHTDAGEDCDDGDKNSDSAPDGCRSDCKRARCGDGVRDHGEDCDDAADNSDALADACRTTCKRAHCGDGVIDKAEECDRGAGNDDHTADACRTECHAPHCGDGTTDALEQCDDGRNNSDMRPDACRMNCRRARCGDAVVDDAESCDDGRTNSATSPNACRPDCEKSRCGDGVIDDGEECDSTPGCDASCKKLAGGNTTRSEASSAGGDVKVGQRSDTVSAASVQPAQENQSCGCRALGTTHENASSSAWLLLAGGLWFSWRRRRAAC